MLAYCQCMRLSLSPILDFVLPRHAMRSDHTHRRYRDSLLFNILITFVICLALGLLTILDSNSLLTTLFSSSAIASLVMLALLRTNLSLTYVNAVSVLIVSALVSVLASVTGGLESPVTSWMVALPLVTVVLMRGKLAFTLLLVQGAPVLGFIYCEITAVKMPQVLNPAYLFHAHIFAIVSSWLIGVISVASHQHWQNQLRASLSHHAHTDSLTGLMTRGHFDHQARRARAYAERAGEPLSFVVIDLDKLKAINDNHGHAQGDAVIKLVATMILKELRAADFCGRLGGDEFCAALPGAGRRDAERIAERLQDAVAQVAPRRTRERSNAVAVSVGVDTYDGIGEPESIEHYLSKADALMYRQKTAKAA